MQGISKLDYIQLVSINQRLTKSFAPNLIRNQKWKDIDKESRKHLKDLFDIKVRESEALFARKTEFSLKSSDFPNIDDEENEETRLTLHN